MRSFMHFDLPALHTNIGAATWAVFRQLADWVLEVDLGPGSFGALDAC